MKKIMLTLLLGLVFGLGTAYAQPWDGAVADAAFNFTDPTVRTFDWAESGSGMADGVVVANGQIAPLSSFIFKYQSFLVGLNDAAGQAVDFPGLNDTFEYTFVAEIPEFVESVTDLGGGNTAAVFSVLAGSEWYMYVDGDPNANVQTGLGFDDGVLVASGSFNVGETSTFIATGATTGQGAIQIAGLVDFANALYLDPAFLANGDPWIFDIAFDSNLNLPPGTSLMDIGGSFFDSRAGEGNLLPNMYTGAADQLFFKVDGSNTLSVVPEPSTVLLLGVGLLGLAGYGRKKMK